MDIAQAITLATSLASMDIAQASTLATLHSSGAPGLALLPRELLYALFTTAGLDEAGHWRFEEQRLPNKYCTELVVDAVYCVTDFNACECSERVLYRIEGRPKLQNVTRWPNRQGNFVREPLLTILPLVLGEPAPRSTWALYGSFKRYFSPERFWSWSAELEEDLVFSALLRTEQMKRWLSLCEKWVVDKL